VIAVDQGLGPGS